MTCFPQAYPQLLADLKSLISCYLSCSFSKETYRLSSLIPPPLFSAVKNDVSLSSYFIIIAVGS
jgi:hypothetical protein